MTLLFALLVAVVAIGQAAAAGAQPYRGCQAAVTDVTVTPGQTITVTGTGADPGGAVTALITTAIGSGVADASGNFSFPATIPADLGPGTYTLRVICGNGGVAAITLELGSAAARTGPVAKTGSESTIPLARLGIALLAAGGLVLAVARRRRRAGALAT